MTVVVVIPSRGRPERARSAVQAIRNTAAMVTTSVVLAVDHDDPAWVDYIDLAWPGPGPEVTTVTLREADTGNLVKATNTVSMRVAQADPGCIIGNLGDDHHVRTSGWDRLIEAALVEPGIAYGDDLIQGEHLPTAPFISARIVLALGWFFLPTLEHLYGDDGVKRIGKAIGRLSYVPEVVTEHVHPAVGKADWDAGYERANNPNAVARDFRAYQRWLKSELYTRDIANVTAALR